MRFWLLGLVLLACEGGKESQQENVFGDADGDGVDASVDCDDTNPDVYPEADEVCDGFDNDCDGAIDDADNDFVGGSTFFADIDLDGFGDPAFPVVGCEQPLGYADNSEDCDDENSDIHPEANEICDGLDNDCDTLVDDDDAIVSGTSFFADADGDGFGDPSSTLIACVLPDSGYVENSEDCNDSDAEVNPLAQEVCGGGDNNCDGLVDEEDPTVDLNTRLTYYLDNDGDAYGSVTSGAVDSCSPPDVNYVVQGGDCDDQNSLVNPGATEVCDGVDNNCDLFADDDDPNLDPSTTSTYYEDQDGDGFGVATNTVSYCEPPVGYSDNSNDCNDTPGMGVSIYPGAPETCDGLDNDCDNAFDPPGSVGLVLADGSSIDFTADFTGTSSTPATPTVSQDGRLNLCSGTFYVNAVLEADIDIVASGNVVLDGANQGTVLKIESSSVDVTVDGITIQNGDGTGEGLSNANRNGGGVHCYGFSTLSVTNTVFIGNNAGTTSDYGYGGGLSSIFCDVTIGTSEFTGNSAGGGGAIFIEKADLDISDSTFNLNLADDLGGAIMMDDPVSNSSLTANTLVFTDNAAAYGGALSLLFIDSEIENSSFTENYADYGGVFHVFSGVFNGNQLTVESNDANYVGGAIFIGSGTSTDPTTTSNVTDSSFVDNAAGMFGGAIGYLEGSHSLDNTLIMANSAATVGGGLFIGDLFDDNQQPTSVDVVMNSTIITDNSADFGGAVIVQLDGRLTCNGSPSEVSGIYNNGNTGTSNGGVVYLYDTSTLSGNSCDLGTGVSDNNPADVFSTLAGSNTNFGDDETFSCDGGGCN